MAKKSVRVREHWRRPPRKRNSSGVSGMQVVLLVGALAGGAWLLNRLGIGRWAG